MYIGGDILYTVYIHKFPNNKVYVGITCKSVSKRWGSKGQGYKSQQLMWRAIEKYGWDNVEHIIVKESLCYDEACLLEKHLIAQYKSNNAEFGYNKSTGGDKNNEGNKLTDEQRKRLSEAHKGKPLTEEQIQHLKLLHERAKGKSRTDEVKQKISRAKKGKPSKLKGRTLSNEVRQKISNAKVGHTVSEETREKLRQINLGKKASEETIQKQREHGSQYWKGKTRSDETKQKISETLKRRFNDDSK